MSKKIYIGNALIKGSDGKSAYQSWLDQGNIGTEAEFVESLKGEDGVDGKDGKDGAPGPQGPQGPQGNTGSSVDYPYELVNNLTTDDATKGLSAAMGKELNDTTERLIDCITEERASINLFNKDDVVPGKYINTTSGALSSLAAASCSAIIPVTAGHYYLIRGRIKPKQVRCLNASNSPMKPLIASTGVAMGNYELRNEAGTATVYNGQFLVPEGAVAVQFGIAWSSEDYSNIMLTDLGTTYVANPAAPDFEPYGTMYDVKEEALPDYLKELGKNEGMPTQVDFMDFGGNLFDRQSPNIVSGYVNISNGTISPSSGTYKVSDYTRVREGQTYTMKRYSGLYGAANSLRVCYYDKNKTFKAYIIGTASGNDLTFTIPNNSDAYYIRMSVATADLGTFMLVEGSSYPAEYKSHLWSPNQYFDTSYLDAELVRKIEAANPLYGKRCAYDGDSIAFGGQATSPYGWSSIIAENNDGTYLSIAASGGTITTETYVGSDPRHWICNGVETLYNRGFNPDYVIFEGGTNDADLIGSILDPNNLPEKFGSWTPYNFTGPFDKTTFCGAVEYMFQKALSLFPHTKFGFIIAQKMGRYLGQDAIRNRKAYFDVIMQICEKWGVPYIDLWDAGFLCPAVDAHYDPTLSADQNEAAGSLYRDGQHLTLWGYKVVSAKIEAWMKTL